MKKTFLSYCSCKCVLLTYHTNRRRLACIATHYFEEVNNKYKILLTRGIEQALLRDFYSLS